MTTSFLDRYGKVFGRPLAMMLRVAGLDAAELTGDGAVIVDDRGARWIDFGSFGIHLLGHCHPDVTAVAAAQLRRLNLSSKILVNANILLAAERLVALFADDRGVLFANSGSEAIETSLKMCRLATGRHDFLALDRAYHGRTEGALQLSAHYARYAGAPPSGRVTFCDPRDPAQIRASLATRRFAALYVEPVQGEGGIHPLCPELLRNLARDCHAHGTLFVSDEIQTGLGRVGTLVSCPQADAVVFGKTLAGGVMPVAAVVFRTAAYGKSARDPLVSASSFAGGALAGAVAAQVLDIVSTDGFIARVGMLGAHAMTRLRKTLGRQPGVRDIRGAGLMLGVEYASAHLAGEVMLEAAKQRLLVTFCLSAPSVLRIYPPAVADSKLIDTAIEILAEATAIASARVGSDTATAPGRLEAVQI
jgi:acetylornithine aminotransferase/putrescine aminotransferase